MFYGWRVWPADVNFCLCFCYGSQVEWLFLSLTACWTKFTLPSGFGVLCLTLIKTAVHPAYFCFLWWAKNSVLCSPSCSSLLGISMPGVFIVSSSVRTTSPYFFFFTEHECLQNPNVNGRPKHKPVQLKAALDLNSTSKQTSTSASPSWILELFHLSTWP